MLIHISVESTQPFSGTATTEGAEPLHFDGWLELLRVISELVAAAPPTPASERRFTRVERHRQRGAERPGKGGKMRIGLAGIFVDDQDRAERFYTEVLGLKVKTSAAYSPGERWLSVVSPEEPDGVELVLHLADEPARTFQAASRELGRPVFSLRTDDCVGVAGRLKAKGVVFLKEPARMAYGGMDAVFDDTCGNLVNLHQD
jgi:catechol 2,3-dioxygenase-like lactoylglutathione lyase family enzyme